MRKGVSHFLPLKGSVIVIGILHIMLPVGGHGTFFPGYQGEMLELRTELGSDAHIVTTKCCFFGL